MYALELASKLPFVRKIIFVEFAPKVFQKPQDYDELHLAEVRKVSRQNNAERCCDKKYRYLRRR